VNKQQHRIQRIADVVQEYLAAQTAADWLAARTAEDPSFGRKHGWEPKGGHAFLQNLESTYLVRMYAEFEAGLRDYWASYLGRDTQPPMVQLLRHAIPTQAFSRDCIDNADDVRKYRNHLVHDSEEEPPPKITLLDAKKYLCDYFSRLDPRWK
jgi:hypothetical protein